MKESLPIKKWQLRGSKRKTRSQDLVISQRTIPLSAGAGKTNWKILRPFGASRGIGGASSGIGVLRSSLSASRLLEQSCHAMEIASGFDKPDLGNQSLRVHQCFEGNERDVELSAD